MQQRNNTTSRYWHRAMLPQLSDLSPVATKILRFITEGHAKTKNELPLKQFILELPVQHLYDAYFALNGRDVPPYDEKGVSFGETLKRLMLDQLPS